MMTVFLDIMELCIMALSFRGELWTNISTQMFCGVCGKMCGENILSSGTL
jgi:hypothetical protein